jgi:glutathione synthase/RimK-type ligase-like ATP-grasp enzyme
VTNKPLFFHFKENLNNERLLSQSTNPLELIKELNLQNDIQANPKILILTNKSDMESDLIGLNLLKNGIEYNKIIEEDIPLNSKCEFHINTKQQFYIQSGDQRIDLKKIQLVLFRYFDLRFLSYLSGVYQIFYSQQWYQTFLNLKNCLKCTWINDPEKTMQSENRLLQLTLAKKVGFKIPKTLITNDPVVAKNFFIKNSQSVIIKVLHHHRIDIGYNSFNFFTKEMNKEVLDKIDDLVLSPIIFQTKIKKLFEIRVTIIGDKIFACKLEADREVYSDIHKINEKDMKFNEIELDDKVSKKCLKLMKKLGLKISSIDLIIDKESREVYFLEINPICDWLWIENKTQMPITNTVCNLLQSYN